MPAYFLLVEPVGCGVSSPGGLCTITTNRLGLPTVQSNPLVEWLMAGVVGAVLATVVFVVAYVVYYVWGN